jgi:hypothetical protein
MTSVPSREVLEQRLRSTFGTKAEQLAVPAANLEVDLPTPAIANDDPRGSRAPRRRTALLWAAAAVFAIALALVLVLRPWASGGGNVVQTPAVSQPKPPPCELKTRGEAQVLPCDPGDGNLELTEKVVVADGDIETNHWQLEVYESKAGLCVDLRMGPGAAGGCGSPADPVGVGVSRVGGVEWLHGPVRKDVARLRVELSDGQALDVSPVGDRAGFPVNFYVVVVPAGAEVAQVISLDAAGDEIGRQIAPRLSEHSVASEPQ